MALMLMVTLSAANAKEYPDRPIRLLIAYAPGGATDIVGRMLAQELSGILGQPVVVENRAGGGTLLATETVKRSQPDGYTLLFATNAFVITPLLHDSPTYNPLSDFAPIALTTEQALGLFVSSALPIHSVSELITYAKNHPGKVNFASSGNGSAQHLAGEAFKNAAGIDMIHVPYKGTGPALIDLLAGRVDIMFTSLVGNMEHIKSQRLQLIATSGMARSTAVKDIPTISESGLNGFEAYTWQGLIAPAHTPAEIIEKLNAATITATHSTHFIAALAEQGMYVRTSSPSGFEAILIQDTKRYQNLLKITHTSIH
jgi:tripartite-type tricarboxylate transporter receptor subunit TctC